MYELINLLNSLLLQGENIPPLSKNIEHLFRIYVWLLSHDIQVIMENYNINDTKYWNYTIKDKNNKVIKTENTHILYFEDAFTEALIQGITYYKSLL